MIALKPAVRVHRRITEIGKAGWDACAANPAHQGNPFISYAFLDALEQSGCAVAQTGWAPHHLAVEDETGAIAAVMPLYLKSHSQGEYGFDHSWAQAYEQAGGRYYPKLQCASPFSPVTGPRLLVRADTDPVIAKRTLLSGAVSLAERLNASSVHITFPSKNDWDFLGEQGLLQRQDQQYHWHNAGYASFEDFLGALSSNRRKTIRRERRDAQAGLEIIGLTGESLTEQAWDAFYQFYEDTGARKWGRPYLNRQFFTQLGQTLGDRVLLVMAKRGDRFIAGALNLVGDDCIYGRNWGAVEDVPFLHFELCYYQAIEHAIRLGLPRVEAGAQGQHKIARGYLPAAVYSAHFIADQALREPVRRYLDQERAAVQNEMDWLAEEYSPFKAAI
jgi:predicted N-acyltransferase